MKGEKEVTFAFIINPCGWTPVKAIKLFPLTFISSEVSHSIIVAHYTETVPVFFSPTIIAFISPKGNITNESFLIVILEN